MFAVYGTTNEFQLYKIRIIKSFFELLGVCANFEKRLFSSSCFPSVRPRGTTQIYIWDYFYKIWFLVFFKKLRQNFLFLKIGQLKFT